ncbi:MAG TPA: hypothetical protein VF323_08310 [Candidatus Limnocylindrales bacterium]
MTDRSWRLVAATLAVILALLAGATIAFVIAPGAGSSPTPPASFAVGSPSGSASPGASASFTPTSSAAASASALAASASPSPSATAVPIAQVTFTALKLDPRVPANAGLPRFILFRSDGPGTVTAQLKAISPQGTTHMCLRAGSKDIKCGDAANATLKATTTSAHVTWRVSLEGTGMFTPTVELTVTFPAAAPSVTIVHARFDGTGAPDTNGIQAIFMPRAAGKARIVATWGPATFKYQIDATNQSSGTGSKTLAIVVPASHTDKSVPVTAGETWKFVLQNTVDTGTPVIDMTATLSWP